MEATAKKTDVPVSFLEKMVETIFKSVANIQESVSNGLSISRNGSVHTCTDKIKVIMFNSMIDFTAEGRGMGKHHLHVIDFINLYICVTSSMF